MIDVRGTRVLFVLDSGPPFSGRDYRTSGVGGTESCVVLLGEALAARGAKVVVANRVTAPVTDAGVRYVPVSAIGADAFDLVVLWKHWSESQPAHRPCVGGPDAGNVAAKRSG